MRKSQLIRARQKAERSMKAAIKVYLKDGSVLEGTTELRASGKTAGKVAVTPLKPDTSVRSGSLVDFSMPVRPFMKRYGHSLSGPKKLTLLIAHLAAGETDVPVLRSLVEKHWSRMNALMGGRYNGAYDTRARDQNWISSPKPGSFCLQSAWEAILR